MSPLLEVRDLHENKHLIEQADLKPRRASYGFIVDKGRLLVQDNRHVNKKYWLIGGATENGETPEETVAREALEEAGEKIAVGNQIYFHEYDFMRKKEVYYHCKVDYYQCTSEGKIAKPIELAPIAWLPIAEVSPMSFHILIQDAVRAFLSSNHNSHKY